MLEAVVGFLIKILTLLPGVRSWAIRRFGRLEMTPINGQGINIFHKRESENTFFVKLQFHARANTKMEIMNVDFDYGQGFTPVARHVWDNAKECETDSNFRLREKIALEAEEMHRLALQSDFVPNDSTRDYDKVTVKFEISSPGVSGIVKKAATFNLVAGGALEPSATQRL
jgi:hypothetical protein